MVRASRKHEKSRRRSTGARGNRTKYALTALILVILILGTAWYVYVYAPGSSAVKSPSSSSTTGTITANLLTSQGIIVVELYNGSAPKTVTNFVRLAQSGFYDNLVWHRVVKGFVIQTGDPNTRNGGGDKSTWGSGGSPQTVPLEIDPNLHNFAGYLGIARGQDRNSGSSQFFINLADNSASLDRNYTVFGRVIKGMDVVQSIGNVSVDARSIPLQNVYLISVTVRSAP